MSDFWKKLKKPFFALAPMANVTDAVFRMIISKYSKYGGNDIYDSKGKVTSQGVKRVGGPDVFWTEFVSADGLVSDGKKKLVIDLKYSEAERPIVAQLFSANPEKMEKAANIILKLGFDGLDINMGCPDRAVVRQGAGGALIKNPKLAVQIIEAAKRGVSGKIPVSIKTRVGYSKNELETWLPVLLGAGVSAITIHARTVKEMSKVPARWESVKQAVKIRNRLGSETLIIGNGDVSSLEQGKKLAKETGADGVMIGRGIFGNPFLFSDRTKNRKYSDTIMRFKILVEHAGLFEKLFGKRKRFDLMKKHFKAYASGFKGARELRIKLMGTSNAKQVKKIVGDYSVVNDNELN